MIGKERRTFRLTLNLDYPRKLFESFHKISWAETLDHAIGADIVVSVALERTLLLFLMAGSHFVQRLIVHIEEVRDELVLLAGFLMQVVLSHVEVASCAAGFASRKGRV